MKKFILSLIFLASFTGFAEAQTSRNPCYTTGALTTQGIANCIGVGTSTPLPVTNSGTQTVSGAVTVGSYPTGATAVTASSGNIAANTATATLAASVGKTTYICGFSITSSGSTAAAVVSPTVTNVITGTMTYTYASVAGVTLANQALIVPFQPCIPANATNTTIPVSLPSLGAGSTNATVSAWGYQQ